MAIKLQCQCGQSIRARDDQAGKHLKCPKCNGPIAVPEPGPGNGSKELNGSLVRWESALAPRQLISDEQLASAESDEVRSSGITELLAAILVAWKCSW